MRIGPYTLDNNLMLAPMAGVTDRPFRQLCKRMGAGLVVSEMLSSNPKVWNTAKSQARMNHEGEEGIRSVQIAGADPELMAQAAQFNVENGAQIIDINMGCPAKKVNKKLAGSALLQYPSTVESIIKAVVNAVDVPVTLKIRTGWNTDNRNGVEIARIAEQNGIQSLAVHGRTRACMYKGEAEFDTIRRIKAAISIPVIANGDITSPEKAQQVLNCTGADGVMIGRGAQGNPWIFKEILHYLETGENLTPPPLSEQYEILHEHVANVQSFYGEVAGVRIARKHVGWYLSEHDTDRQFRKSFNAIEDASAQLEALNAYFEALQNRETRQISPAA
ncbi:tRNA dihydrouridine synthase DusB [Alteromonas sp. CI.11.F.A3]|uniref:tRNA dihydrouridine synthase DusB n=1 Tax=Alteromonas sp. CI.11.F.A3 TaxID=3079555 RepID=UPI001AB405AF|nr:tRNA dihydrouridine synthase DusB [Alteromonas sp. CI.11.F.A3]WOI37733.1 tRNA dihydrouridine synthase DusB [Alteromonas sp. CI.11.F.A3]|mmetsp:Transcript_7544/g.19448  ORF Transcript_7544/g.19448 Transcript_7544/m.19448 type:complete len:333 (+) Transcript_7544:75-1073(+)|eukprot:CAMPEP_0182920990 /NCGR_PEP_ID=MMETSP0105_2-20130417/3855_1 /TAXON_ID=81532 ORGANISM="Acanthoeca-like sp., Strain 10tr" /NCGR_SAMPLE_ID=MMETSP0105_2 /ASSEMBLY_ACC=CAM_ASM_000205 /LENGTH=332 /DNA_ID=CAMNT_0025058467 /DNA_START=50 /DNA_END=1051 /DNA_ORIENTATION=-